MADLDVSTPKNTDSSEDKDTKNRLFAKLPNLMKVQSLSKESTGICLEDALKKLRPIPTLLKDDTLYFCTDNIVAKMLLEG